MKKYFFEFYILIAFFLSIGVLQPTSSMATSQNEHAKQESTQSKNTSDSLKQVEKENANKPVEDFTNIDQGEHELEHQGEAHHSDTAPPWTVIPFVLLLLMIATGPLFYEHFWHHNYPKVAISFATLVVGYYVFVLHNSHAPIHAIAEYVQFIALLAALYIASGGIMIKINRKGTPLANVTLLLIGAVIANLIGTTGASMLLIKPFIRLNKGRIRPYHIIFFIAIVSNIGGSLTPIGDPPLFLGFLKGVPFFWTLVHNLPAWMVANVILALIFYLVDKRNKEESEENGNYKGNIQILGTKNFAWLTLTIGSVFLDPNVLDFVPYIPYDGQKISFLREVIMLSIAYFSYKWTDDEILEENSFSFEPIREVAFIFIGIFGTMMPALELVGTFAKSEAGAALINHNTLYWGTGLLSGFLDNAPTYLNFLAAAMASQGASISNIQEVQQFSEGSSMFIDSVLQLKAISIAAVFFGTMTYIGNGPNFMVKSIAEQSGVKMPSFFGYILRYSLPILLPLFFLNWLIFFAFEH